MKKAVILHGTGGNSQENWFPWLKKQLEEKGYKVWYPDLPGAERPNMERYLDFILKNRPWSFDGETILIGHSSGAVTILFLLQNLAENEAIDKVFLVGAFSNDLGWDELKEVFLEPFDFAKIKQHAQKFIFIHSDDDPHCPLEQAEYLSKNLDGELVVKHGEKHFSISTAGEKYREFPFLLDLIFEH